MGRTEYAQAYALVESFGTVLVIFIAYSIHGYARKAWYAWKARRNRGH